MVDVRKFTVLLIILLLFGATNNSMCFAAYITPIQRLDRIDLPQELNFAINDICTEHAYFMQAAANELGNFAIYTRHVNPKDNSDVDFNKVYIDLYHNDGKFMYEMTFTTPLDLAIELGEASVNIYFYDYMLIFDFLTQELSSYSIPEGVAVNSGLYKHLRSKSFVAGDWTYSCQKAIDGYIKLTRSNDTQEQILVEMPGNGNFWSRSLLVGGGFGAICITIVVWQFMRKHHKTGDGLREPF